MKSTLIIAVVLTHAIAANAQQTNTTNTINNTFVISASAMKYDATRVINRTDSSKDVDAKVKANMDLLQKIMIAAQQQGDPLAQKISQQGKNLALLQSVRDKDAAAAAKSSSILDSNSVQLQVSQEVEADAYKAAQTKISPLTSKGAEVQAKAARVESEVGLNSKRKNTAAAKGQAEIAAYNAKFDMSVLNASQAQLDAAQRIADQLTVSQKENIISRMFAIPGLNAAGKTAEAAANMEAVNAWVKNIDNANQSEFAKALHDQLVAYASSIQGAVAKMNQMSRDIDSKNEAIVMLGSRIKKVTEGFNTQSKVIAETLGVQTKDQDGLTILDEDSFNAYLTKQKETEAFAATAKTALEDIAIMVGSTNASPDAVATAVGVQAVENARLAKEYKMTNEALARARRAENLRQMEQAKAFRESGNKSDEATAFFAAPVKRIDQQLPRMPTR